MVIIMVLYVRMGLKIRSSIKLLSTGPAGFQNSAHYDCKKVRSRRSVIRMLSMAINLLTLLFVQNLLAIFEA